MRPSDHLYFLPPRRHIDAEGRLRLLSSSNFSQNDTDPTEGSKNGTGSRISSWLTLSASWQFHPPQGAQQQSHSLDHSHAVPLSDGHHILFVDNATGLLCLGSDTPLGSVHRLSRKIVFIPPDCKMQSQDAEIASVYAAAQDPDLGVRVAAAYSKTIVLYSVPPDVLKYSTAEQENAVQPSDVRFDQLEALQLLKHPLSNAPAVRDHYDTTARFDDVNMQWLHYLPINERAQSLDEIWPLRISGVVKGSMDDIATLAVQETPLTGLTVWAFDKTGSAKVWSVDDIVRPVLRLRRGVDGDGGTCRCSVCVEAGRSAM